MGYWAFIEGVRAPPTQRVAVFLFPQSPQESIPKARVGPEARGPTRAPCVSFPLPVGPGHPPPEFASASLGVSWNLLRDSQL